jgi:hypothetical protein
MYWQRGDSIRCQFESKQFKEDALIRGPRLLFVRTVAGSKEPMGTITQSHGYSLMPDPWYPALFRHFGEESGTTAAFDEIMAKPHRVHSAKKVREDGRDLVYIHISHKRAGLEFWFDPQVNYLIRKTTTRVKQSVTERTVQEFREVKPGIFFPALTKAIGQSAGKVVSTSSATISQIKINDELPADVFDFRFPPGMIVKDSFKNALFKTDANGQPTLPPTDNNGKLLHVAKSPPLSGPETKPTYASAEEARQWSWWLLPAAGALLLTGSGFWLFQRWRRAT